MTQLNAFARAGLEPRQVLSLTPGQHVRINVDRDRAMASIDGGPLACRLGGSAEVFPQQDRPATPVSVEGLVQKLHFLFDILDGKLIERMAIRLPALMTMILTPHRPRSNLMFIIYTDLKNTPLPLRLAKMT